MAILFGALVLLFGLCLWMVLITYLRGWVLSIIWGWFMVPLFHLPALPVAYALGISLLVGMLCKDTNLNNSNPEWTKDQKLAFGILYPLLYPLLTLLLGWIFKSFLPVS